MNEDNFNAALTSFRTKLIDTVGPIEREERAGGPFGNQVVTLFVSNLIFEIVLDRGSIDINLGPSDASGERYSLDFLHMLLFPSRPRSGFAVESDDLNSIADWMRRARGSGNYSCYKKAYDAFEHCLNFASIGQASD